MRFAIVLAVAGCSADQGWSRTEKLELIRDVAAQMGVHNGALFAGIAISETQLAHCWSEATYACKGPASPSCDGEPVIAGSADGPCTAEQGGLGMFQFDAGRYGETLAVYGDDILTIEGNTAQAVSLVIDRAREQMAGVNDWMTAARYLDNVPLVAGDPATELWARFLACHYNGCCAETEMCAERAAGYRDNAIAAFTERGAEFWDTHARCAQLPEDGIVDQRTDCYVAGGTPRFWRHEPSGFGDDQEWTLTTDAPAPANFARWLLPAVGTYELSVFIDGGDAAQASYRVVRGETIDTVVIDQIAVSDFVSLGTFVLTDPGSTYVELGDNTGIAQQKLVFDALRATRVGP
ncbi:MAG: hypothetical protein AB7P03_01715 [Kofleriaceae bacterium]